MEQYLDFKNNIDNEKLELIANEIKIGKVVAFPTETVYGIGVNALSIGAVRKLYEIKQRDLNKPISVLVDSVERIKQITLSINDDEMKIINNFLPGPLTIVLDKNYLIPDIVTSGGLTIGIRIPQNEIALELIKKTECPLAVTSANISGEPSITNCEDIIKEFHDKVDYFIDSGPSKLKIASTVVRAKNGEVKILRQGSITKEEIERVIYDKG